MSLHSIFAPADSKYTIKFIVGWLWKLWKGHRLQTTLNALIGLSSVAVNLGKVWAVKHAIDIAAGNLDGSIPAAVAVMAILTLSDFGLNILSIWVKNILGIKAQNRMQQLMLDRILRSEWHGKESRHSGDIINRLEFDVTNVVRFLTETLPATLSTLALFIGAFFFLYSMDKLLALVIIAILPVFMLFSRLYVRRMRKLTRKVRESDSKVQSILQETIRNRMVIKTLESNGEMVNRLEEIHSELRHNVVRRTSFSVWSSFIASFGFSLGYLVAFTWSAFRLANHTLTFGGMTAFLQLVHKIQAPARTLTSLVPEFVSVLTAAERLIELEETPTEEQGDNIVMAAPCGIRFNHVYYRYDEDEGNILEDFSFDFKPGTCTAILGETGAGKTTMIRMVLALIRPQQGSVEIYDADRSVELSALLRCNFVYVPQGNTLMSGTIRENLRLGKLDATDEEMLEALHKSCADFVADLPAGLDTVCSESGGGLSEGQAQRIAIARALLRNRSVMLFDESTSALDPDTEKKLLNNLLADNTKTILFITHRPAIVAYSHQSITIERR